MRCDHCRRDLAEDELVYRASVAWSIAEHRPHRGAGYFCAACGTPDKWGFAVGGRRSWGSPTPCENCQRPVVQDRRRKRLRRVFCSGRCQATIYNRLAGEQRKAYLAIVRRVCASCGAQFNPRRSDAVYCTSPCRQLAYRERRA
jgi:endogenous inhibitor of DNA gyrase (YacG/DUF329 family)